MYIQVYTRVCVGGVFSFVHVKLEYIQEHSYSYGRAVPEVRISVKGEPRTGDDPFTITFLLKMASLLIAAHWNCFLYKSETAVPP